MEWRPFKILNERERSRVAEVVAAAAAEWAEAWLPAPDLGAARCIPAGDGERPDAEWWVAAAVGDAVAVHVAVDQGIGVALLRQLLGNEVALPALSTRGPAQLGRALQDAALADLAAHCVRAAGLVPDGAAVAPDRAVPAAAIWARGALAAMVEVPVAGAKAWVVAGEPFMRAALAGLPRHPQAAGGGLVGRRQTLGTQKVKLQVTAGVATITVSDLRTLAVGDVIALPASKLGRPFRLLVEGTESGVGVFLGALDGHRAIQLAGASAQAPAGQHDQKQQRKD